MVSARTAPVAVGRALVVGALVAGCAAGPGTPALTPVPPGATASTAPGPSGPATVDVTSTREVTGTLDVPWGLDFLPDGTAVVTLRDEARVVLVGADGTATDV